MSDARKITLQFPSLRAFLAEYGERISPEGMLLRGEAPPAAGSKVDIEVVVAEGMRLLRARGETLWSGAAGSGSRQRAAAVRFQDLDDASRTLIAKIVEQRQRKGAEPFRLADVSGPREARLRDLTRPAAAIAAEVDEPGKPPADEIFDLAEPPADAAVDLFAPLLAEPPDSLFEAPEPVAPEPPAPTRRPKAPLPLLADPEPAPFDLVPEPEPRADGAGEPPDRTLDPATGHQTGAVTGAESDLNDLFGGDESQREPARGRTEAFPASFVDEVEAELLAAEPADSSYLDVDTSELEIQLGGPVDEPEPVSAPRIEPPPPPIEPVAQAPVEDAPPPAIEPDREPEAPPAVARGGEAELRPEPQPPSAPALEIDPQVEIEPEAKIEPEAEVDLGIHSEPALEQKPEAAPATVAEADRQGIGALPEVDGSRPQTSVEADRSRPEVAAQVDTSQPEAAPAVAPPPDLAKRVAEAFDAARGRETVEIPVKAPPAAPPADSAPPSPAAAPAPPGIASPPSAPARPAPAPPTEGPPAAAPMDDNLLSIPELRADGPEVAAEPVATRPVPSSAEALRGAAGSSRHLGTWLLITLLAAALGVAGYFLWGLTQKDAAPVSPVGRPNIPAAPLAGSAAEPAASDDEAGAAAALSQGGGSVAEPPAPAAVDGGADATPAAEPADAAPEPSEPAAPLTGLDRITWNESGDETLLALVGDGAIARQSVELVTIGGEQPRLVIKLSGVQRAFPSAVLEVGTSHVDRVRTGLHAGGELHVVVDLASAGTVVRDLAVRDGRVEVRLGSG